MGFGNNQISMKSVSATTLRDMPPEERPREKLARLGASELGNHELLAVILGRGSVKEDVLERSKRVLGQYTNWDLLRGLGVKELQEAFDLPFVQACQVAAVFELGKRLFEEGDRPFLSSPQKVFAYVQSMASLKKEHLRGLYLDAKNRLVRDELVSIGTLTSSPAHPREVFSPAIEGSCASVIVVHNHPSGDPEPSALDIALTKKLVEAGKILEIPLLDHLIVAKNGYVSLKDRGVVQ